MNQMNQFQDDGIDFFALFETLWDGKWLISAFVAIALLLGGGVRLNKEDPLPASKLIYSVDTIPTFHNAEKVIADFRKKFYSVSVFEDWKKNNSNEPLVFEDFSPTVIVDGFVLSRDEGDRLVTLVSHSEGGIFLVRTNSLLTLNSIFEYANHVNRLLKNDYVLRANEELKLMESLFRDLDVSRSCFRDTLPLHRYVIAADKGANVLAIQRPQTPKVPPSKSSLIFPVSGLLGGLFGVFVTLVRNAFKKRKEVLAES